MLMTKQRKKIIRIGMDWSFIYVTFVSPLSGKRLITYMAAPWEGGRGWWGGRGTVVFLNHLITLINANKTKTKIAHTSCSNYNKGEFNNLSVSYCGLLSLPGSLNNILKGGLVCNSRQKFETKKAQTPSIVLYTFPI